MTKCLITGCSGFIGSYLTEFLIKKDIAIYGTVHQNTKNIDPWINKITVFKCNILDKKKLEEIMSKIKPDLVFHLAAQSNIPYSWQKPEETFNINILGTLNLFNSIRKKNMDPLIQVVCSSGEYGYNPKPIKENNEFKPSSPYGVSKIGQDMLSYLYWDTYKMRIIRSRPFYIIGPRKTSDAPSEFAKSIISIERGRKKMLTVGNLENIRDMVDVRDCVNAMWLMMKKGKPGNVYNICTGKGHKIKDLLNIMASFSTENVKIQEDPKKMRPSDEPILVGDNSAISKLGWKPRIPIEKTLSDILNYWREQTR